MQKTFHKNNIHNNGYDFDLLASKNVNLLKFIQEKHGKTTIDFSDPYAVRELNKSLLQVHYGIKFWEFSDENLCPPIPGRVDYIHHLASLIVAESAEKVKIFDIGTGATCIYPLLGNAVYNWEFIASDIDRDSLVSAQRIIDENSLENQMNLRFQKNRTHILEGVLKQEDAITATMCNPPFFASAEEAMKANNRKSKNLGNTIRNFGGSHNELWYKGGEKAFLHTYLYESSKLPMSSKWFTSLVSKKENVLSLKSSSEKLNVIDFKVIPMHQGNKVTRIVCWRFFK